MNKANKYANCWCCDNIISNPNQIGLMYLGFPRCFVLVRDHIELFNALDYDDFFGKGVVEINWLDPSDKSTETEKQYVLATLWNFFVEQEQAEEEWDAQHQDYDDF